MNDLLYNLLLNHSSKRKVLILTLLSESVSPISLGELEEKCDVSRKTLEQDIQELITDDIINLELVTYQKKNALKKNATNVAILDYMDSLISESPLLLVIESIFSSDQETLASLAEKLFITESTLRKYLTVLKRVLREYGLKIQNKPLDIVGNEGDVRYFYFNYFKHVRKKQILPFSLEKNDSLYNVLNSLMDYGAVLTIDYHRLVDWFLILERRIKQKKKIRFSEEILQKYLNNYGIFTLKVSLNQHFPEDSVLYNLDNHEILYIYLTSLDTIIYGEKNHFFSNDFASYLENFDSLVSTFLNEVSLDFCSNLNLKSILQAFLANATALTDVSPLFQKNESSLKRIVERNHPDTLKKWQSLLEQDGQFLYAHDIAISLTLLTESQKQQQKKILFALTGEPSSLSYSRELALKIAPRDAEVAFLFNQPLDDLVLKRMSIDICVYNFTPLEPISEAELIRLSEVPLETEWNDLLIRLHNV